MLDLTKTTLIIPIKIEHRDRYRNAEVVLNFLNSNFQTNVFIFEVSETGETSLDFAKDLKYLNIKHWCIKNEPFFHRTKYLNIMLDKVETPVVVNYDIDVILSPENFMECQDDILNGKHKVIYPYELGNGQIMVLGTFDYYGFKESGYSMSFIDTSTQKVEHTAECGHCIFFNRDEYRKWGGENEDFISYGPEDKERMIRFQKITKSVIWKPGKKVYHFEHHRGSDSNMSNIHFEKNWEIYRNLEKMKEEELISYYRNQVYKKKYSTFQYF